MPRAPGMLSDGIAAQRDQRRHLLGLDAVALAHAGAVDPLELAARARVQHRRSRPRRAGTCRGRPRRRGAAAARLLLRNGGREQVVGLAGRQLDRREAERLRHLRQPVELLAEVGRRTDRAGPGRPAAARGGTTACARRGRRSPRAARSRARSRSARSRSRRAARPACRRALDVRHRVVGAVSERVSVDHEQRRHAVDRNRVIHHIPFRFSALR